jgi:hypothetical protein
MPVLGDSGILRLRREAPDAVFLPFAALNTVLDSFQMINQDFWTGDEVWLSSPFGIPVSADAIPSGLGMYVGGLWSTGANRAHIADDDDDFYVPLIDDGDDELFYGQGTLITGRHYFIHRDQFDRVSFYTDYASAMNGTKTARVPLFNLSFDAVLLSARGTADYDNAMVTCQSTLGPYKYADIISELTLASICDSAPTYESPTAGTGDYNNADVQPRRLVNGFPWSVVCLLREWTLNLDGPSVDTTCIEQKFGEAVKSIVSGGGSIDFMVDRQSTGEGVTDPTSLLQLLLLTEKGAKAEAEFWMIQNRKQNSACTGLLDGDLYYKAEILVTNTAINVRPDDLIAGSAQFVTTGPIALRMGQVS